ncbi:MAG TPA: NADH-quinone oxidoreductase subunit N, partial [Candidatus Thermoplasmatota archaeon]|nr:NADH-quinone oxidoreductase subunit N [Candidatus Thermoplasmatota archaeon]
MSFFDVLRWPLEKISQVPFSWQGLTPELLVLLFALLAPLVALRNADRRGMQQFAAIGLGGAFLLTLGSLRSWSFDLPGTGVDFTLKYLGSNLRDAYVISEASQLFKLIFLGTAFIAVLGMSRPLEGKTEEDWGEFVSLLMFATLGMMVVASSRELMTLVLGLEMASISSYLLAAFRRDALGAEAGLKYFVIGAISTGLTLFGVSLLYGMAGTTNIAAIGAAVTEGGGMDAASLLGIALLLGGLGFKISMVPFHAWAPDVYCGSPVPVAGVLAASSKAMGFVAVFQVFLVALMGVKANWELAVALLAVATMTVGNLVALQQTSVRRMLAYSSIAQAGYLLIAVAVGTTYAVSGGVLHLIVNAAMKMGAFLVVGAVVVAGVPDRLDTWRGLG